MRINDFFESKWKGDFFRTQLNLYADEKSYSLHHFCLIHI